VRPENHEIHRPVLLKETINLLESSRGGVFIDATLGLGGHSRAILEASDRVRLLGIDQDIEALRLASESLKEFGARFTAVHANFAEIDALVAEAGIEGVDGILADLGVSSLQFDSGERGFSFRFDAPLDMRMDAESDDETAAELLERLSEEEIANVIYNFGEERKSRRIARRIVERREDGNPVATTGELAALVEKAVGRNPKDKIHPATRTFQALRIAVNHELEVLETFIDDAIDLLNPEGRMAIITFHSLEDRIVKQRFLKWNGRCSCPPRFPKCVCGAEKKIDLVTRKPVVADDAEIEMNPRARSAKLRVCKRTASLETE
jgi:16S rRNA (cytosine1402-N4)-methyltransferase